MKMKRHSNAKQENLVLALGNWYQQDDAIALVMLERLKQSPIPSVKFKATEEAGLSLLDYLVGYEQVILIDAMISSGVEGKVHILKPDDFHIHAAAAWHQMGIPEILQIGKELKLPMPRSVYLIGITVNHCNWGEDGICMHLQKMLPQIESACQTAIRRMLFGKATVENGSNIN